MTFQMRMNPKNLCRYIPYIPISIYFSLGIVFFVTINSHSQRSELDEIFDQTCNGELQQTPREKRRLRCRYVHNNVPFRFIAPFKKEELNLDPSIAYYHDSIYEKEIEQIFDASENYVERSTVGDLNHSGYSDVRTSQNTWLDFAAYPFLNNIAQRLRDVTGLSLESGEHLQVANYGLGGHYGAHYDFSEVIITIFITIHMFFMLNNCLLRCSKKMSIMVKEIA